MNPPNSKSCVFLPDFRKGNPYQARLAESLAQHGYEVSFVGSSFRQLTTEALTSKADVFHLHWPEPFVLDRSLLKSWLKTLISLTVFKILKFRGKRIALTLHNLGNHEQRHPRVEAFFYSRFVRLVDVVIAHCQFAGAEFERIHGNRVREKTVVIPHGNYIGAYPSDQVDRQSARQHLELPAADVSFLFLGRIRPYKGILDLVNAFKDIDDNSTQLVIVGKTASQDEEELVPPPADDRH